jgi:hypothetical protein
MLRAQARRSDLLSARVTADGSQVGLRIENLATHQGFSHSIPIAAPDDSSAEGIADAPSACVSADHCRPPLLPDFRTTEFTHASARTLTGQVGSITDPAFATTEMPLASGSPTLGPAPVTFARYSGNTTRSRPTRHGRSFNDTFKQGASPAAPPPPALAAADRLRHTLAAVSPRLACAATVEGARE